MSADSTIDQILLNRRIIITCGTGGVGKTTVSAALALRAATLGRKAVVITIDPAKRLATSLGLKELGDSATDITPLAKRAYTRAKEAGKPVPPEFTGTLSALMPDTRRTWESFVHTLAPNPQLAERVIQNPIFQVFAKEFSGTNEYMALERVYTLDQMKQFDCIILDTPPSRNTLAFLDAPQLLAQFFDAGIIKYLVLPANKIVAAGMKKALGVLERLTGKGFMTHLFDFAQSLFEVRVGFIQNLKHITALLESRDVGFLLVAAPTPDTAPELRHFIESIREHRFHFDGVALNRTLSYFSITEAERDEVRRSTDPELKKALELLDALQARELKATEALTQTIAEILGNTRQYSESPLYAKLPELARDVHSVEDLFHVAMAFDQRLRA